MSDQKKPNRNRAKTLTIRFTQEEYDAIQELRKAEGCSTMREFILKTAGCRTYTESDNEELQKINEMLADYDKQLRGMATNLNQIAIKANSKGELPTLTRLQIIYNEVIKFRKEVTAIWESIRQQIKLANTRKH